MQKDDCTYHKGSSRDDVKAHKDTSNQAMKNYIDDYKINKHPDYGITNAILDPYYPEILIS